MLFDCSEFFSSLTPIACYDISLLFESIWLSWAMLLLVDDGLNRILLLYC